jgi:hypothetical protein
LVKIYCRLKNTYIILLFLVTGFLFSCSTPEEKWIADYKQIKCDSVKLSEKIEDEIKTDLKDTLTSKETLEKDLKMLTAPKRKRLPGLTMP